MATFVHDGDGNLVKKVKPDGNKTIYVGGGVYEVDKSPGGSIKRTVTYYPVAGAMRIVDSISNTLYYTLKDHLGSASVVTDATGAIVIVSGSDQRYYPYGESRLTGTMLTDKLFTGQRDVGLGIYHYGARFYSPKLGRFLSPDTIIPVFENPQSWNRFSYAVNNPIRYDDPDGHCAPACAIPVVVPFVALAAIIVLTAIAIHPDSRAAALNSMEYVSKRDLDKLDDFAELVEDTNTNRDEVKIRKPCWEENPQQCLIWILGIITIGGIAIATGGIDQDESLATSPTFDTLTPSLTPASTPTPPNTSTSTPSCPPYNNGCPTSSPTPGTTSTPPVSTSPTPPVYTPAPGNPGGPVIPI